MKENKISIFNDVLGPVITGPSSSNTAGALRVTRMMRNLMPDFVKARVFVDDTPGAFAPTIEGLKSGVAFAAGLLDFEVDDTRIADARKIAAKQGLHISYEIKHFKDYGYAELVEVVLENGKNESMDAVGASIGGGMARLLEINGVPVSVSGSAYEILLYSRQKISEECCAEIGEIANTHILIDDESVKAEGGEIYELRVEKCLNQEIKDTIRRVAADYDVKAFFFEPILTIPERKQDIKLPFQTAAEMDSYLGGNGKNMFEAAMDYETARSGWSREQVMDYAVYLVDGMRRSTEDGLKADYQMTGYSVPYSDKLKAAYETRKKIAPMGVAENASYYAMSVMELNSGMGRIVTCPTAGSSGIMPGVLLSMIDHYHLSDERAAEALLVGGLVGMFVAHLANFDGSDGACQAEVASGCAMAAASACYLMGGTTKQIENAAVLSFESLMGLICDPVAMYPEVPCILRNPMGSTVAFTMANLALTGYDPFIPLDEIIIAMRDVGYAIPPHIRCQRSGCCGTPTALKIQERMQREHVFRYEEEEL